MSVIYRRQLFQFGWYLLPSALLPLQDDSTHLRSSGMRRPSNPFSMLRISWVLVLVLAVSAKGDGRREAARIKRGSTVKDATTMMKEVGTTVKDAVEATTTANFDCGAISEDAAMDDIFKYCVNETSIDFEGQYIDISGINKKLANAFLSTKTRVDYELRLKHNTEIDKLDLSGFTHLGQYNRKTLTIIDTNLRAVIMESKARILGSIIIRGNRYLEKASSDFILTHLKKGKHDDIDIQEYPGECLIDPNNVNLKDCTRVYQKLELEDYDFEANAPNFQPEAVTGCIKIGAKAKVHETMFDNLVKNKFAGTVCNETMYIRACLRKSIFHKIKVAMPDEIVSNFEEQQTRDDCSLTCNFEDLVTNKQDGCDTIQGNVNLKGRIPGHVAWLLTRVKHINGSLILNGTIEDIITFSELRTITSSAEPALSITNNERILEVKFPKLEKIATTGNKDCIEVKGNAQSLDETALITKLKSKAEGCGMVYDRAVTEVSAVMDEAATMPMFDSKQIGKHNNKRSKRPVHCSVPHKGCTVFSGTLLINRRSNITNLDFQNVHTIHGRIVIFGSYESTIHFASLKRIIGKAPLIQVMKNDFIAELTFPVLEELRPTSESGQTLVSIADNMTISVNLFTRLNILSKGRFTIEGMTLDQFVQSITPGTNRTEYLWWLMVWGFFFLFGLVSIEIQKLWFRFELERLKTEDVVLSTINQEYTIQAKVEGHSRRHHYNGKKTGIRWAGLVEWSPKLHKYMQSPRPTSCWVKQYESQRMPPAWRHLSNFFSKNYRDVELPPRHQATIDKAYAKRVMEKLQSVHGAAADVGYGLQHNYILEHKKMMRDVKERILAYNEPDFEEAPMQPNVRDLGTNTDSSATYSLKDTQESLGKTGQKRKKEAKKPSTGIASNKK